MDNAIPKGFVGPIRETRVCIGVAKKGEHLVADREIDASIVGDDGKRIPLDDVLISDGIARPLYSMAKLTDKGYHASVDQEKALVMNDDNEVVLTAPRVGDIFLVPPTLEDRDRALRERSDTLGVAKESLSCEVRSIDQRALEQSSKAKSKGAGESRRDKKECDDDRNREEEEEIEDGKHESTGEETDRKKSDTRKQGGSRNHDEDSGTGNHESTREKAERVAARKAGKQGGCQNRDEEGGTRNHHSNTSESSTLALLSASYTGDAKDIMHQRWGHVHTRLLREAFPSKAKSIATCFCESCAAYKMKKPTFPKYAQRKATERGDVLSYDDHPRPCRSRKGEVRQTYIICHKSDYMLLAPVKGKFAIPDAIILQKRRVETKFKKTVQILRADSACWNKDKRTRDECDSTGTVQEYSNPGDKQQNGKIERHIQTAKQTSDCIADHANTPPSMWPYADQYAVDILNHLPRKKDGKVSSRADEWNGYHDEQMLSLFRVFGCLAIVRKEPDQVRMGEKQTFRGVFLGFATQDGTKAYNVLNIESRKVVSARTVQFNETQFPFRTGKVVVPRLADYDYGESKTSEHQSALPSSSVSVSPQYVQHTIPEPVAAADMQPEQQAEEVQQVQTPVQEAVQQEMQQEIQPVHIRVHQDAQQLESPVQEEAIRVEPRRSARSWKPSRKNLDNIAAFNAHETKVQEPSRLTRIPQSRSQAMRSQYATQWMEAERDEIQSHLELETTKPLAEMPQDTNGAVLRFKWVYDLKFHADGSFDKFKARMVLGGHVRTLGVDHTSAEVYADVLRMKTFRSVLAVAVQHHNVKIDHWDLKTAFLNAPMTKLVYTMQPPGYEQEGVAVLRVMKAIYGLPESMRLFVDKLKKDIMDLGFVQSRADPALYILKEGDDFMWLPTVVDDLYPVYTSEKIKQRVFDRLAALYRIDDRGELRSTQGIRIDIDIEAGIIKLDQQQFKENLLAARNLLHCKSAPTPALTKQGSLPVCTDAITKEELEMRGNWPYRETQGELNWLVQGTCPNYAFSVSQTASHQNNWRLVHKQAQQRILRHMSSTVESKLIYRRQDKKMQTLTASKLVTMTDSSHATNLKHDARLRSQTGILSFMYGNLVYWKSGRQDRVATSPQHAEVNAADEGVREMIWERLLLEDLGHAETGPSVVWWDNKGVIDNTLRTPKHSTNKHLDVKLMYKNELYERGEIMPRYLETSRMVADALTKQLSGPQDSYFSDIMLGYQCVPETHGIALRDAAPTKHSQAMLLLNMNDLVFS